MVGSTSTWLVGASIENAPYGLAVAKSSGLTKPMLAALKVLMANGTYTKILSHWGIQEGAITNPTIESWLMLNPARFRSAISLPFFDRALLLGSP